MLYGVYRDHAAVAAYTKRDDAVGEGKKRVVASHSDVTVCVVASSALTDDDIACADDFPAKLFKAEILRFAIPSVSRSSLSFFCCHGSLSFDGFDLDNGELLTVSPAAFVALTTLFLKDNDLFAALVF